MSNLGNGKRTATASMAIRLARLVGVSLDDVLAQLKARYRADFHDPFTVVVTHTEVDLEALREVERVAGDLDSDSVQLPEHRVRLQKSLIRLPGANAAFRCTP